MVMDGVFSKISRGQNVKTTFNFFLKGQTQVTKAPSRDKKSLERGLALITHGWQRLNDVVTYGDIGVQSSSVHILRPSNWGRPKQAAWVPRKCVE